MELDNQRIVGETLRLNGHEMHALGPNLELVDCHLKISCSARSVIIGGFTMVGGKFHAAKRQMDRQYYDVRFERTEFSGNFTGCDFGNPHNYSGYDGNLIACDFSKATLDLCGFMNVDLETCTFAPWPTVVILNPSQTIKNISTADLPEDWRGTMASLSESQEYCTAVVIDVAVSMVKRGGELEELRKIFAGWPFMKFHG